MKTRTWLALLAALTLIALAAVTAGCGGDANSSGADGNDTDAAFVNDMVPHHEAAVEMAELAKTRAEHPELRRLDDIIAAQNREIDTMRSVKSDLAGEHGDHMAGDVHMSGDEHSRGMGMDPRELRDANPFDREFIDMMIPHHQGAITMAKEELEKGENTTLRGLAKDIVSSQEREIAQMREWRKAWYRSSAGSDDSMHGSDDSMHGE